MKRLILVIVLVCLGVVVAKAMPTSIFTRVVRSGALQMPDGTLNTNLQVYYLQDGQNPDTCVMVIHHVSAGGFTAVPVSTASCAVR